MTFYFVAIDRSALPKTTIGIVRRIHRGLIAPFRLYGRFRLKTFGFSLSSVLGERRTENPKVAGIVVCTFESVKFNLLKAYNSVSFFYFRTCRCASCSSHPT